MKDKPILFSAPMVMALLAGRKTMTRRVIKQSISAGSLLWVRERFALVPSSAYRRSDGVEQTISPEDPDMAAIYAAGWDRSKPMWRPSIHMPRWASRITLHVTNVKTQRVHNITDEDAIAEGVIWSEKWAGFVVPGIEHPNKDFPVLSRPTAREMFAALWSVINDDRAGGAYSWAANPWVAAYTFEVIRKNIDDI